MVKADIPSALGKQLRTGTRSQAAHSDKGWAPRRTLNPRRGMELTTSARAVIRVSCSSPITL